MIGSNFGHLRSAYSLTSPNALHLPSEQRQAILTDDDINKNLWNEKHRQIVRFVECFLLNFDLNGRLEHLFGRVYYCQFDVTFDRLRRF
jgi:hypothetical protein